MLGTINADQQTLSQRSDSINQSKETHATVTKIDPDTSVLLNPESMTVEQRRQMSCSEVEQRVRLGFYYQELLSKAKTSEEQAPLSWPFNFTGDSVNQVEVSAVNKEGTPSVKAEMKSSQRISRLEHEAALKNSIRNTNDWLQSDKAWGCGISKKTVKGNSD